MRILHFNADALDAPYGGGQARRAHEINKRLAVRHEITVVSAGHTSLRSECRDGVRYLYTLPLPHPVNFVWYFAELPWRACISRVDLIVEDFSSPFTASGVPLVVRRPVIGVASYLFGSQAARRYRLPIDRWEAFAVARYRHIIALTPGQQERLKLWAPGSDIRVIPNAADDEAFASPWRGDGDYIAFVGRFDWRMKGLDLLLDAVPFLPEGFSVRIAGGGPGTAWLEREVGRRRLGARVHLVGRLDGASRHEFVRRARVLAFPSRYENQSLVALDAMAIGAPIVAFDTPSSRETFVDAAWLVPAFDAAAFGRALATVASDARQAQALAQTARARGAAFTWDAAARAQEEMYCEVVGAHAAPPTPSLSFGR
jgi:glycogen(starch) synthase